ncbi:glycosyltransferase family 2 protein, partial [Alphaproteobacteria bacterium]|nr:glycosyltransferase family 2 protein [Alphaproteobacteria bacterium]
MKQLISIIIPVFCEADNIKPLLSRIIKVTSKLKQYEWNFCFVNDGSTDNSFKILKTLASKNKNIKVIDFSRNFGKEVALTAGVHSVKDSAAIICIDADLQHPPELIPSLIIKWKEGYEIVITKRILTKGKPFLRKIGALIYYWLMKQISQIPIVSQTTDFRLYDKIVINEFIKLTEKNIMFRSVMDWMGFKRVYVDFEAGDRLHGDVSYSYKKLIDLAINSITSFSLWPLRLTGYLGIIITSLSSITFISMIIAPFFNNSIGLTPMSFFVVGNTFLIGIVLIAIGLV